jgi:arylsulfatase A-like enzyme
MRALQALALAAGAASAAPAAQQAAAPAPKPHLIYLLADDYGWANVGFHAADMHTPNIDRMATEEGFELGRLYAYRFCSPTRSALMSGRLPFHVNQNNNAKWGWTEAAVKPSMKMLPEKLQEAGYYTVHAGKWHLGLARQAFTPVGRGFNESLAMLMGSEQHFTQRNGLGPSVQHVDLWASDRPALDQNGTYSANLFGGFGERVLRRHAAINEQQGLAEPLFMYLAYTVTHSPEQAPAEYVDRYPADWVTGRRLYAGMASALDDSVGNITRTLKEVGMWPNTLVVFSSDKCVGATVVLLFHMLCCDARPV